MQSQGGTCGTDAQVPTLLKGTLFGGCKFLLEDSDINWSRLNESMPQALLLEVAVMQAASCLQAKLDLDSSVANHQSRMITLLAADALTD